MSFFAKLSCSIMIAVTLGLTGCQMGGSAPVASMMSPTKGIVVTTANGVRVYVPTDDGKGVKLMSSTDTKACAMCEKDAMNYFTTGKLIPVCSECNATRVPVGVK